MLTNGHDLRDIRLSSLRRHASVVPQESMLFHTTLKDNPVIAEPGATVEEFVDDGKGMPKTRPADPIFCEVQDTDNEVLRRR